MSLKIDEYLNSVGALAPSSSRNTNILDALKAEYEQRDSYTASETNSGAAIPCDNYNDILKIIQKSKAESLDINTPQESLDKSVKKLLSDDSKDSEEKNEATQKIVTINGVTYLETTVVIDGIKVVTRTAIRGEKIPDIDQIGGPNDDISVPVNLPNS